MRLRKAGDFRAVFAGRGRGGRSGVRGAVSNELMTLHIGRRRGESEDAAETPGLRFGFTISKKTAKRAHDRNLAKRRLSEIARLDVVPRYARPQRYDCIVVVRPGAIGADYAALRRGLLALLGDAGLIDSDPAESPEGQSA